MKQLTYLAVLLAALLFARLPAATAQTITSDQPSSAYSPPSLSLEHNSGEDPIYACACGCAVFDVGTGTMLPQGKGGTVWFEWDYLNQTENWHGTSAAPANDNDDKAIRTNFYKVGMQYFFNRSWGVQLEVPLTDRYFKTADGGELSSTRWTALGDIRVKGLYTGFFEDMSLGIDFGLKLPTGDYTHPGADRDTDVGSGSTDALIGGYYRHDLSATGNWTGFLQVEAQIPFLTRDEYRPGIELNGAAGVYYEGFSLRGIKIVPLAQLIVSARTSDGGDNSAHPVASGYQRLLLSPGLEFDFHPFMVYADAEIPVWQYFRGDQLVSAAMFKVILSYSF